MTEEQLQAIRARRAAVTPGTESGANLMFIANSRADVDALLAEVDRLRAKLAAVPVEAIRKVVRHNDIRFGNGFSPLADIYDPVWAWLDGQPQPPKRRIDEYERLQDDFFDARAEVDHLRRHNAQLEEQLRLANGREADARLELGRVNADAAARIASLRGELEETRDAAWQEAMGENL